MAFPCTASPRQGILSEIKSLQCPALGNTGLTLVWDLDWDVVMGIWDLVMGISSPWIGAGQGSPSCSELLWSFIHHRPSSGVVPWCPGHIPGMKVKTLRAQQEKSPLIRGRITSLFPPFPKPAETLHLPLTTMDSQFPCYYPRIPAGFNPVV